MELQNYKVSAIDPFFTAEKWNGSLEYSENFEGIISAILGKKFKGIYKPHKSYAINDYVWHDGKCYMITGENSQVLNSLLKENVSEPYYIDNNYLCLVNGRLSLIKDGNAKTLNNKVVEKISYYDSKEFAIGMTNNKIFKLNFDGTYEQINITHSNTIIKIVQDDMHIYCLTADKTILKAETSNGSSTYFDKLNLNISHEIIDISANDKYLFALTSNSDINIFNKQTGGKLIIRQVNEYVKNINKAKITSPDNYTIAIHDGEHSVITLFMENSNIVYSDKLVFSKLSIPPTQFSYSNNKFTLMNGDIISSFISSRYSLKETNLKMLINATSSIELNDAYFGIDFTKGQLVSVSNGTNQPIGFKTDKSSTNSGVYNDGTNIVEILNGKGAKFTSARRLKYNNSDTMINKIIFIEFDKYVTNGTTKSLGYVSYSNRNGVKLIPSPTTINEPFKCIIRITGNTSAIKSETFTFKNSILTSKTTQAQSAMSEASRMSFAPESGVEAIIRRIAIIDSYDMDIIDVLSSCSFSVPEQATSGILPNSVIRSNENGAISIRTSDESILNSATGVKVNSSSNVRLGNAETMLNTVGSKALDDKIVAVQNSLPGYSPINHKHNFSEILSVPSASTAVKGIVQLSTSVSNTSETIAATSKAVKTAYDKASHGHPYAPTSHSHSANDLPKATTGAYGVVQLSNNPNSESQVLASTPFALRRLAESLTHAHPYAPSKHSHTVDDLPTATTSAKGVVQLSNSHNGTSKTEAVTPYALSQLASALSHGHDYVPTGGYKGTGQALLNEINTKVKYVPGHAFEGIHRGDGNALYWKGPDTGWIRFWDSNAFDPNSKLNITGGTISGNLTVNGTLRANAVTQASDIRLKSEVKEIKDPLDSLMKLNGYSYVLNSSGEKDMGVIAQELEEVFPELVVTNEDGMKSVKYNSLLGVLIEAVKELKRQVDAK